MLRLAKEHPIHFMEQEVPLPFIYKNVITNAHTYTTFSLYTQWNIYVSANHVVVFRDITQWNRHIVKTCTVYCACILISLHLFEFIGVIIVHIWITQRSWIIQILHYRFHKKAPLVPVLSQINPVHALPSCFFKIRNHARLHSTQTFLHSVVLTALQAYTGPISR